MYSPLNTELMFQQMEERAAAMREAKAPGKEHPQALRRWRTEKSRRATRRTR